MNAHEKVLEQIEEGILGPVEILHEDGGETSRRELLEQRDPGILEVVAGREWVQVARDIQPERQPQDLAVAEAGENVLRRIPLQDAELLLEDLPKSPERDLTVRETPARALQRLGLFSRQPLPELTHEAGLAESCIPDDRHQQRPTALPDVPVGGLELLELPLPPDEGRTQAAHPARPLERQGAHELSSGYPLRLAFGLHSPLLGQLEGATDGGDGPLSDQDFAGSCRLLEPGGHVHRVPAHERRARACAPDNHVASVHAYAQSQLALEELPNPALHGERRVQRAFRMILESGGCPEDGHDSIARELLHRPAGASDLVCHRLVETLQAKPDALGIVPGRERGRSDEVGKQHRGQLSFLTSDRISRHGLIVTPRHALR